MSALKLGMKILHEKNHINVLAFLPQASPRVSFKLGYADRRERPATTFKEK